jgi:RNAse (barnase) inhibitor barstar
MSAAGGAASDNAPPVPAAVVAAPPEIHLDGRAWTSASDFYDAFLPAVHAPSWHTRSLDALNDSLLTGGINGLESFTLVLRAPKQQWPRNMRDFMTTLRRIFDQAEALQGANAGKRTMRIVRDDEHPQ